MALKPTTTSRRMKGDQRSKRRHIESTYGRRSKSYWKNTLIKKI